MFLSWEIIIKFATQIFRPTCNFKGKFSHQWHHHRVNNQKHIHDSLFFHKTQKMINFFQLKSELNLSNFLNMLVFISFSLETRTILVYDVLDWSQLLSSITSRWFFIFKNPPCTIISNSCTMFCRRYVPEGNMTACGTDYLTKSWKSRSYIIFYSVFVYFLPLFMIIYIYTFIVQVCNVYLHFAFIRLGICNFNYCRLFHNMRKIWKNKQKKWM